MKTKIAALVALFLMAGPTRAGITEIPVELAGGALSFWYGYMSGTYVAADVDTNKITLTEKLNVGGGLTFATNQITAATAGTYKISVSVGTSWARESVTDAAVCMTTFLNRTGAGVDEFILNRTRDATPGGWTALTGIQNAGSLGPISGLIDLVVGDLLEFYFTSCGGSTPFPTGGVGLFENYSSVIVEQLK